MFTQYECSHCYTVFQSETQYKIIRYSYLPVELVKILKNKPPTLSRIGRDGPIISGNSDWPMFSRRQLGYKNFKKEQKCS